VRLDVTRDYKLGFHFVESAAETVTLSQRGIFFLIGEGCLCPLQLSLCALALFALPLIVFFLFLKHFPRFCRTMEPAGFSEVNLVGTC
jgi:hypothetical protein